MNFTTEAFKDFVDALEIIDDEEMRFEYIIDLGKKSTEGSFPEGLRTDQNLMEGCMSKVWITNDVRSGRAYFKGYSDAIIVRGLVVMMTASFSGLTNEELQTVSIDQVQSLNLGALTTQRQLGMLAMLEYLQKLGEQSVSRTK